MFGPKNAIKLGKKTPKSQIDPILPMYGGGLQEGEGPRGLEGVCGELGNWGGG